MTDMTAVIAPKSDQINADDLIAGDLTITITGVQVTPGTEQPVSMSFAGSGKVYRPCKSMSRVMVAAWGPDAKAYPGRSLTLYRDPKVKWGGMEVGGIRIRAMTHIDRDLTLMLSESKANRKPFRVSALTIAAPAAPDTATLDEARAAARNGKAKFTEWWSANPDKRATAKTIMADLQRICAEADAIDPFGLPPVTEPTRATDAEIAAQIAADIAARDDALEGGAQ